MATAESLCKRALQKIRVHSEINPATEDQLSVTFYELKGMLASWRDERINIGGKDPEVLDVELGVPSSVEDAIVNNLSCRVAPDFGKDVSNLVVGRARKGMDHLRRHFKVVNCEDRILSELLPRGEGTGYGFFDEGDRMGGSRGMTFRPGNVVVQEVPFMSSVAQFRFQAQTGTSGFTWTEVNNSGSDIVLQVNTTQIKLAFGYRYEATLHIDGSATPQWAQVDLQQSANASTWSNINSGVGLNVGQTSGNPLADSLTEIFLPTDGHYIRAITSSSAGTPDIDGVLTIKTIGTV